MSTSPVPPIVAGSECYHCERALGPVPYVLEVLSRDAIPFHVRCWPVHQEALAIIARDNATPARRRRRKGVRR